jgi:hypothetical protein
MDGAILQVAHIAVLYSSIFTDSDASSSLSQSVLKTVKLPVQSTPKLAGDNSLMFTDS